MPIPQGAQLVPLNGSQGNQSPDSTLSSIGSGLEETGSDIWAMVNPMTSGALGAVSNAYQHISEAVPLFQAYEGARSSGKGIVDSLSAANDKAKQIADAQDVLKQRVDEFKKNPTQATTRAIGDAAALAASIWAGGKLADIGGAAGAADVAPEAEAATEAGDRTPATATAGPEAEEPGLLQQVFRGEKVAQQPAQAAVRQAAGASAEAPILEGNSTRAG